MKCAWMISSENITSYYSTVFTVAPMHGCQLNQRLYRAN